MKASNIIKLALVSIAYINFVYSVRLPSSLPLNKDRARSLLTVSSETIAPTSLDTSDPVVQKAIVNQINIYRRQTKAGNMLKLTWDPEVQQKAQAWADICLNRQPSDYEAQYLRTSKFNLGQTFRYVAGESITWPEVIQSWYNEIKNFKYGEAPPRGAVDSYTQLVWAMTSKIGCAHKKCSFYELFVCDYGPAGNKSPHRYEPYLPDGKPCSQCPSKCDNGLCTNPCNYGNFLTNCDDLFPNGCTSVPAQDALKAQCQATCNCKGKGLLY